MSATNNYKYDKAINQLLFEDKNSVTYLTISSVPSFATQYDVNEINDIDSFITSLGEVAKLNIKTINNISNILKDDDFIYVISKPQNGISLRKYINQNPKLSVNFILFLFIDLIKRLKQYASVGLYHQNINIDNLYIANNQLCLLSFGSTALVDERTLVEQISLSIYYCLTKCIYNSNNPNMSLLVSPADNRIEYLVMKGIEPNKYGAYTGLDEFMFSINNLMSNLSIHAIKTKSKSPVWVVAAIIGAVSVFALFTIAVAQLTKYFEPILNSYNDSINDYSNSYDSEYDSEYDYGYDYDYGPNSYAPSDLTWYTDYYYEDILGYEVVSTDIVTEENGWLYYRKAVDDTLGLYKKQIDTGEEIKLIDNVTPAFISVSDSHIYFIDCGNYYKLFRCDLNGRNIENLTEAGAFDLTFNKDKSKLYFIDLETDLSVYYFDIKNKSILPIEAHEIGDILINEDELICFSYYDNTFTKYVNDTFVESISYSPTMRDPIYINDKIYYIDSYSYALNLLDLKTSKIENILFNDNSQFDIVDNIIYYVDSNMAYTIYAKNLDSGETIDLLDNVDYFKLVGDKIYFVKSDYEDVSEKYISFFGSVNLDGTDFTIIDDI